MSWFSQVGKALGGIGNAIAAPFGGGNGKQPPSRQEVAGTPAAPVGAEGWYGQGPVYSPENPPPPMAESRMPPGITKENWNANLPPEAQAVMADWLRRNGPQPGDAHTMGTLGDVTGRPWFGSDEAVAANHKRYDEGLAAMSPHEREYHEQYKDVPTPIAGPRPGVPQYEQWLQQKGYDDDSSQRGPQPPWMAEMEARFGRPEMKPPYGTPGPPMGQPPPMGSSPGGWTPMPQKGFPGNGGIWGRLASAAAGGGMPPIPTGPMGPVSKGPKGLAQSAIASGISKLGDVAGSSVRKTPGKVRSI